MKNGNVWNPYEAYAGIGDCDQFLELRHFTNKRVGVGSFGHVSTWTEK